VHLLFLVVVALLVAWGLETLAALALFAVGLRRARHAGAGKADGADPGPVEGGREDEGES